MEIKLSGVISEDRQLIVELPDDTPIGPVELIIQVQTAPADYPPNPEREAIRAKLAAAGMLSTYTLPPDAKPPTSEELRQAGTLPQGTRPTEALIQEDRGEL